MKQTLAIVTCLCLLHSLCRAAGPVTVLAQTNGKLAAPTNFILANVTNSDGSIGIALLADGKTDFRFTGGSNFARGSVVYLSTNGNDSTGQRGRSDLPFQSTTNARLAAVPGDTIFTFPGLYEAHMNIMTNGVTWFVEAGTTFFTTNWQQPMFGDLTNAMTNVVLGRGIFRAVYTNGGAIGGGTPWGIADVCNSGSDFVFEALQFYTDLGGSSTGTIFRNRAGKLKATAFDTMICTNSSTITHGFPFICDMASGGIAPTNDISISLKAEKIYCRAPSSDPSNELGAVYYFNGAPGAMSGLLTVEASVVDTGIVCFHGGGSNMTTRIKIGDLVSRGGQVNVPTFRWQNAGLIDLEFGTASNTCPTNQWILSTSLNTILRGNRNLIRGRLLSGGGSGCALINANAGDFQIDEIRDVHGWQYMYQQASAPGRVNYGRFDFHAAVASGANTTTNFAFFNMSSANAGWFTIANGLMQMATNGMHSNAAAVWLVATNITFDNVQVRGLRDATNSHFSIRSQTANNRFNIKGSLLANVPYDPTNLLSQGGDYVNLLFTNGYFLTNAFAINSQLTNNGLLTNGIPMFTNAAGSGITNNFANARTLDVSANVVFSPGATSAASAAILVSNAFGWYEAEQVGYAQLTITGSFTNMLHAVVGVGEIVVLTNAVNATATYINVRGR